MYLIPSRFLDTCHTICIWLSLWSYLIDNYGNLSNINNIYWYGTCFNFTRYINIDNCNISKEFGGACSPSCGVEDATLLTRILKFIAERSVPCKSANILISFIHGDAQSFDFYPGFSYFPCPQVSGMFQDQTAALTTLFFSFFAHRIFMRKYSIISQRHLISCLNHMTTSQQAQLHTHYTYRKHEPSSMLDSLTRCNHFRWFLQFLDSVCAPKSIDRR